MDWKRRCDNEAERTAQDSASHSTRFVEMPSTAVVTQGDAPVVKRQKISNGGGAQKTAVQESRIFTPFRVCLLSQRDWLRRG